MYNYRRLIWDCNHSNCYSSNEPTSLLQSILFLRITSKIEYLWHMSMNQSVNYPLIYTNLKATSRYTLFIAFCFYFLILCKYFLYITTTLYTSYNASMRYLLSFLFMSNLNFSFIYSRIARVYTVIWKYLSLENIQSQGSRCWVFFNSYCIIIFSNTIYKISDSSNANR